MVPRQHLESIGLDAKGQRIYGLANGSEVRMDVTVGQVEFMGEIIGATIVMGEANAERLLGVTALESVGNEVDPRSQTLTRLPFVRLRGFSVGKGPLTKAFFPNHPIADSVFLAPLLAISEGLMVGIRRTIDMTGTALLS